jgi:hypothetical protein
MHLLVSVAVQRALEEAARRAPVILGIDDLQWLDEPSARALGYALRRLGGSPVWLVAARRHEGRATPGRPTRRDGVRSALTAGGGSAARVPRGSAGRRRPGRPASP